MDKKSLCDFVLSRQNQSKPQEAQVDFNTKQAKEAGAQIAALIGDLVVVYLIL